MKTRDTRALTDRSIAFSPWMAQAFGICASLMLQQIHYYCSEKKHREDGHYWVWNTSHEWASQIVIFDERTIRNALTALRELKIVIAGNHNKHKYDKTLWYRIDYEKLAEVFTERAPNRKLLPGPTGSCFRMVVEAGPVTIPKTSTKTSTKNVLPLVFDATDIIVDPKEKPKAEKNTILKSISIPKKRRVVPTHSDSIAEVISVTKAKRVVVAATRIADASAGKLTANSLQALLDKAMKEFHPTLPRLVVTAKPFGVLRKRMDSATVQNIPEFIYFSIREWNLIAGRNRAAFLKNPSKSRQGAPLPPAPAFNELCYKLPYFLTVYSQSLSTAATGKESSSQDEQVSRLRAKLQEAERENQNNKEIIRRIRRAPTPGTSPTGRMTNSKPEIQNIPVRTADGARVRAAFGVKTGRVSGATESTSNTPKGNSLDEWSSLIDTWTPPTWQDKTGGVKNGK